MSNIERAIRFYVEQLGFAVAFRYEDFYAGLENNGNVIHLKTTEHPVKRKGYDDLDLIFTVEDLQGLFEAISKREITIVQPLREMPYGKEFYIADPDGNVIAFME